MEEGWACRRCVTVLKRVRGEGRMDKATRNMKGVGDGCMD